MKEWFAALPKFIVGPAAVIVCIIYFVIQDPPKTICDTQFEIFKKDNAKYIYGYSKKNIVIPPGIQKDLKSCQEGNSPGACYDWMENLKLLIHSSRRLPAECGERIKELGAYKSFLDHSAFIFSQISWNDTITVRKGLYNWLEEDDVQLFCNLKKEYIRLLGLPAWKGLQTSLYNEVVKAKKVPPTKEAWERTVLSHPCQM